MYAVLVLRLMCTENDTIGLSISWFMVQVRGSLCLVPYESAYLLLHMYLTISDRGDILCGDTFSGG